MTTRLQDVIVPEVFNPYVIKRTMELSALVESGIVENTEDFDQLASGGGILLQMPYWNDLTGESEVMNDSGALTPGKITANKDVARLQGRAKAWGANGLSALLSGDDPLRAIGDLVAKFWARDMQRVLLATLNGVFSSAGTADNVHDISAELDTGALIDGATTIDAAQKLGDVKDQLTAIAMHSAVESYLAKKELIVYETEAGKKDKVPYYLGRRVIVDDGLGFDPATKAATTYLFGPGAVALGNGSHPRIIQSEVDRDSLASSGEDFLINRRLFILHPRGIKWTETAVAGEFPTNAELSTATNWERVYEPKAIRIVQFKHKIA